jgi:hypothetical protein
MSESLGITPFDWSIPPTVKILMTVWFANLSVRAAALLSCTAFLPGGSLPGTPPSRHNSQGGTRAASPISRLCGHWTRSANETAFKGSNAPAAAWGVRKRSGYASGRRL